MAERESQKLKRLRAEADAGGWLKYVRTENDERALLAGCRLKAPLGEHVCQFSSRYCRHSKGRWAGEPFVPCEWERDILMPLFGWVRPDGRRRFTRASIWMPKKTGKALWIGTPVPTPDGWTTMGELRVGDSVFAEDGRIVRVIATTEIMRDRECFELTLSGGCRIIADAEHKWLTRSRRPEQVIARRTTAAIASDPVITSPGSEGANHSVSLPGALRTPPALLVVPPYVLGAWLGDGHSAASRLTCHDSDAAIVNEIVASGVSASKKEYGRHGECSIYQLGSKGRSGAARRTSLQLALRRLGVLNNKHIPEKYLRASVDQRIALLQGLMDTDGHCTKRGDCEFTTMNERLADGFMELVTSLGFKPAMHTARARLHGRDVGPKWRILFCAFSDRPVFRLERKRSRQRTRPDRLPRSTTRQITAIRRVESVPVRCIQVDSPTGMFLCSRVMIPTCNSTLCAMLANYLLVADGEPGSQVYIAANDAAQAGIVFGEAAKMIQKSPELNAELDVLRSARRILKRTDPIGTFISALAAEYATVEGLNAHGVIIDEVHAFDERGRLLREALRFAGAARRQPMEIVISTAGEQPIGPGWDEYDYAKRVLAGPSGGGIEDLHTFAAIWEADPTEDWTDPAVHRRCNPSYGITIDPDEMTAECESAKSTPRLAGSFKRYRLNLWTQAEKTWLDMESWKRCAGRVDMDVMLGEECWGGLDLSATTDLTAFALAFRQPAAEPNGEPVIALWCRMWLPADRVDELERNDRLPYRQWAAAGWLELTPGAEVRYSWVESCVLDAAQRFKLRRVAYDRHYAAALVEKLRDTHRIEMVEFPQTCQFMNDPCLQFERRLKVGTIVHQDNPILNVQASQVSVQADRDGRIRPVKSDKWRRRKRIDGIVASLMACDMAHRAAPKQAGWSIGVLG